ncbi:hypothetical protein ACLOJK_016275 [Asimina triloba]
MHVVTYQLPNKPGVCIRECKIEEVTRGRPLLLGMSVEWVWNLDTSAVLPSAIQSNGSQLRLAGYSFLVKGVQIATSMSSFPAIRAGSGFNGSTTVRVRTSTAELRLTPHPIRAACSSLLAPSPIERIAGRGDLDNASVPRYPEVMFSLFELRCSIAVVRLRDCWHACSETHVLVVLHSSTSKGLQSSSTKNSLIQQIKSQNPDRKEIHVHRKGADVVRHKRNLSCLTSTSCNFGLGPPAASLKKQLQSPPSQISSNRPSSINNRNSIIIRADLWYGLRNRIRMWPARKLAYFDGVETAAYHKISYLKRASFLVFFACYLSSISTRFLAALKFQVRIRSRASSTVLTTSASLSAISPHRWNSRASKSFRIWCTAGGPFEFCHRNCRQEHLTVVELNCYAAVQSLPKHGFSGTLSPQIGVLDALTELKGTLVLNYDARYPPSRKAQMRDPSHLRGKIPNEFGNLTSLTVLDLEGNRLTGEIPPSLGKLVHVKFLILSHNNLEGRIPDSLSNLSNLNDLYVMYSNIMHHYVNLSCVWREKLMKMGGKELVLQGGGEKKPKIGITFGSIGGAIALFFCCAVLFILWKHKHKGYRRDVFEDVAGEDDHRIAFGQLKRFSWRELQLATEDFNEENVLGKGGFGKVYKGILLDGTEIAVKRLIDYQSPVGEAAFLREVELISIAVHKNLLKLIGFCTTPTEKLLVYPYMKNLSVAYRLREVKLGELGLAWSARKRIALGTARGLEYLHVHCNPKIIHRDVKAANILLDEDFEAVVGDFGLAKLVDIQKTNVTTQVRGTMGHIAPEYLSTGRSSERTDVFGYGIMLLELVSGRRAIDLSGEEDVLLLDHAKKMERENRLHDIVDGNLNHCYDSDEVEMLIKIALLCTQQSPEDRPTMSEVVRMLEGEGLVERWQEWQQVEVTRRQDYERQQLRFNLEDSYIQEAVELSGGSSIDGSLEPQDLFKSLFAVRNEEA